MLRRLLASIAARSTTAPDSKAWSRSERFTTLKEGTPEGMPVMSRASRNNKSVNL
jgi:hypothetical protein